MQTSFAIWKAVVKEVRFCIAPLRSKLIIDIFNCWLKPLKSMFDIDNAVLLNACSPCCNSGGKTEMEERSINDAKADMLLNCCSSKVQ